MRRLPRPIAALTLALLSAASTAGGAEDVLIRGARVFTVSGDIIENGALLISDGKIAAVGADVSPPEGARVIEAAGKSACPGFIDAHSHLGLPTHEMAEIVDPVAAGLPPLDAVWPGRDEVQGALCSGVTTLLLTPGYANAIAGPCSAVKVGQSAPLKLNAAIQVNLVETAIPRDRKPTSIPGLLRVIRETFTESRDADGILGAAARGEAPALIVCQGLTEVERAVKLAGELGLDASVVIPEPGPGLPEALAGNELGAVVPPLPSSPRERTLRLPADLEAAGVPIAFSSFAPMTEEHDLRTSAALAAGAGLPDAAALRALTLGAAEMLGIADRVGSLEAGKDGDVVILGGHPLDLAAPVEVVIIDGEIIYEREAK